LLDHEASRIGVFPGARLRFRSAGGLQGVRNGGEDNSVFFLGTARIVPLPKNNPPDTVPVASASRRVMRFDIKDLREKMKNVRIGDEIRIATCLSFCGMQGRRIDTVNEYPWQLTAT
jgi:hypothetical protein